MRAPQGKSGKGLPLDSKSERNKIIAMSVLFVLVLITFFSVRQQEDRYREREAAALPEDGFVELSVEISTPKIDAEGLAALVSDRTETDRVLLDRDAIEFAFTQTKTVLDAHFAPLGGRELDDLTWRELAADPAGWRAALFRVRGRVEDLKSEESASGELWRGRVTTADDRPVYFALRKAPQGLEIGEWIRFDAIFIKAFRDEVDGAWLSGPLLAGRKAVRSFEPLGNVTELGPYDFLDVTDADMEYGGKLAEFEPELFRLLAYARDVDPDSIDWAAAPELTNDVLTEIFENGRQWRAKPVRLPISVLLGLTNLAAGENAARLSKVADGWIGNTLWKASNGLIHFRSPGPIEHLREGDKITGRGFFLMNEKYQPSQGGLSVASYFVMQKLERHVPPPDVFARNVTIAVSLLVIVLIGLFWVGLTRDARRAKELREELVRRRRERRAKTPSTSS